MRILGAIAGGAMLMAALTAAAQLGAQPEVKIDSTNRTLSVNASETVSVEPDLAILHIGFDTQPEDAKEAYAEGARTSNAILAAVKQAGVVESDIRSQAQYLQRDWSKPHKFKLTQQWTVKVPAERAAEILDVAVTAGATDSGQIEWTVKDEHALEAKALEGAGTRAKENAEALARGLGVRVGPLLYVSNQVTSMAPRPMIFNALADKNAAPAPPLAIEPHQVSRQATINAVFAME